MIQTDRLILRQWRDEDLESFARLNADPKVMEFFPAVWTLEESKTSMQTARTHIEMHGWGKWAFGLAS